MIRFLQILFAFLVVRVLWGLVRSFFSRPANPTPGPRAGKTEERGRVVGCERCDLHVPEQRAVVRDGRSFCSEMCAAADAAG